MSKYNAKKTRIDEFTFDSKDEARYYEHLKKLKETGKIKDFKLQPVFALQSKFQKENKKYRAIDYIADFEIEKNDGTKVVIDVKGLATETAKLKRKLFEYKYRELELLWVVRNLKYGNEDGWIEYEKLKKKRRGK